MVEGAEVAESGDYVSYTRRKVVRFTPTQIVLDNNVRYWKKNFATDRQHFWRDQGDSRWSNRYTMVQATDSRVLESDIRRLHQQLQTAMENIFRWNGRDRTVHDRPKTQDYLDNLVRAFKLADETLAKAQLINVEIRSREKNGG